MPTYDPKSKMEIYLCDSLYNPIFLVDDFTGFSWTEKYCGIGEFQLTVPYSDTAMKKYLVGRSLKQSNSLHTMLIETVDRTLDDSGKRSIKISGRSADLILQNRVFIGTKWTINGTTQDIARAILIGAMTPDENIHKVMVNDGLPNMKVNLTTNITSDTYQYDQKTDVVYKLLTEILNIEGYGYRLDITPGSSGDLVAYEWRILSGTDKPDLYFDEDLGNLFNTEAIESVKSYNKYVYLSFSDSTEIRSVGNPWIKNVRAPLNSQMVHRVKFVEANDMKREDYSSWQEFSDALDFRGLRELSGSQYIDIFSGSVDNDNLIYNSDYRLGDTVRLRDAVRERTTTAVIDEFTWSYDNGVLKSYPSFLTY